MTILAITDQTNEMMEVEGCIVINITNVKNWSGMGACYVVEILIKDGPKWHEYFLVKENVKTSPEDHKKTVGETRETKLAINSLIIQMYCLWYTGC